MRNWKHIAICGVLAAGLLAGCGKGEAKADGSQPAIIVNGEELSLGTAELNLRYQQAETTATMQMYGMVGADGSLWDQAGGEDEDGNAQTYGGMIKNSIQNAIVQQVLMRQHAADYGVEIPADIQEKLDAAAKETYEANAEVLAEIDVTEENVREMLELNSWQALLFPEMTADVDLEVSDEEAAQSTISYARLKISDEEAAAEDTAEEGAEEAAAEDTAEEGAEEAAAEDTAEEGAEEAAAEDTAEEAAEEDAAEGSEEETPANADNRKLMEDFLSALQAEEDPASADFQTIAESISDEIFTYQYSFGSDNTYLAAEVIGAAAGLSDGEVGDSVIKTADGYYYVIRMDAVFDKEATDQQKETIRATRKQDAFNALLQEWTDAAEVTTTEAWDQVQMTDADTWTVKTAE